MPAPGFEYERKDEKGALERNQLVRALLIPRCWNNTASIWPMFCVNCTLFMMMLTTMLSSLGIYASWVPEHQVNDADHVAWVLRIENMTALYLLLTLLVLIFAALTAPTDGTVTLEPHPPNFILRVARFMFYNAVAFSGTTMIWYFAILRFGATPQSFTEGNIAVQFTIILIELFLGMHPLPYAGIIWPLATSAVVFLLLFFIQNTNYEYVIYAQLKPSHQGLLAGLIYMGIMIIWYLPVAFIFSYKKNTTWIKVEPDDDKAKLDRLRRDLEFAKQGEDQLLIESIERRIQELDKA